MATSTLDSAPAIFQQLLAAYTPEQITAMVAAAQPQPLQPVIPAQSTPAPSTSADSNTNVNGKKRSGPNENHLRKKAKTAKADALKAATRPLNSWMAFRSYYSPMFTSLQQKDISTFLTGLWQADPFKAKWTILAKAYSIIRDDKGKENAPLDSFLAINAPHIGVLAPAEYFKMLGWKFSTNENNEAVLTRESTVTIVKQGLLTTNLSVEDIVQHSYACGYVAGDGNMIAVRDGSTMTMATTAQPTEPSSDEPVVPSGDGLTQESTVHPDASQNTVSGNIAPVAVGGEEVAERDFEKELVESMQKDLDSEAKKAEVTDHAAQLGNNILGQVLLESGDEFPFNGQFDPDDSTDLHYDPFMGDPFNPFDMSDYLNEDMFS